MVPFVEVPLSSFAHDYLDRQGMLGDYLDNRPLAVRCVHPLVTLLEKLDAMSRRYSREVLEPDSFVRHYEDAAQIVRAVDRLPALDMTPLALAEDMHAHKDIARLPGAEDPSLRLDNAAKRAEIERAYERIAPMFWGPRIPLLEACQVVHDWVQRLRRRVH